MTDHDLHPGADRMEDSWFLVIPEPELPHPNRRFSVPGALKIIISLQISFHCSWYVKCVYSYHLSMYPNI